MRDENEGIDDELKYYSATQWQLMWLKFKRHKLAIAGSIILAFFYLLGLFSGFLSPHHPFKRYTPYIYAQPQRIHFIDEEGRFHLRPFVYGIKRTIDMKSLRRLYSEDKTVKYPIQFFHRSHKYKFWNLFETDIHLFGVEEPGVIFLFGTDKLGRDMFARLLSASRISLSVGLIGVALSFVLGCALGGISGYFGGTPDLIIQRLIEFLISIPTIPLWMALSASLPRQWSSLRVYFFITLILSIVAWSGLARVVRGKLISVRNEDFVLAARLTGVGNVQIITRHLLPSFFSYLIVNLTISIPNMILGETALSFLGLGLRPPVVSWGVLLKEAQNVRTLAVNPWLLIPGLFVIVVVLAFNFMGDGMRDAADPYK